MVHIIGITGLSGSGKSTFCQELVNKLSDNGFSVCFISTDWFYKNKPANVTRYNFDIPTAFDLQPLIKAISNNVQTTLPGYDYVEHVSVPNSHIYNPNVDYIIIEGIMLFNDDILRPLLNTKIFVYTDLDVCLARRILRDIKERGRTVESVISQWFDTVKPGYDDFIFPTMKCADYIFNNTHDSIKHNLCHDDQMTRLFQTLNIST